MTLLDTRKAEVVAKLDVLVKQAQALWPKAQGLTYTVRFDLRGAAAGTARVRDGIYTLRFNVDMMQNEAWQHLINDTVPHELAHIMGYHLGYGMNHGKAWRSICIRLGGTGKRCHNESVTYAKGATFEYTTSTGRKVILSQIRHNRVQIGESVYRWRDGSKIDRACSFKKVA